MYIGLCSITLYMLIDDELTERIFHNEKGSYPHIVPYIFDGCKYFSLLIYYYSRHSREGGNPGQILVSFWYFWWQKYPKPPKANKLALQFSNLLSVCVTLRQYLLSDSRFCFSSYCIVVSNSFNHDSIVANASL